MAVIDQNKTEEKALKYASFCNHDDQMIEAVVGSGYFVLVARRTHYFSIGLFSGTGIFDSLLVATSPLSIAASNELCGGSVQYIFVLKVF